ncbi:MAG: hypothetical protein ACFWUE_05930 [Xylanivirga thermophila]|uniref:DUF7225 domain-containing protein n=1 Tax=Xylanivirga thermophila TaxID=2496273 RepID=UPI0039F50BC0
MYIYEKIAEACKELTIGGVYDVSEIKQLILAKTDVKEGNILPKDYCYNVTNKGADENKFIIWPRLFEYVKRGTYIYLGEGYPYNGQVVYAKDKDIYGHWTDGKFERF